MFGSMVKNVESEISVKKGGKKWERMAYLSEGFEKDFITQLWGFYFG